MIVRLYEGHWKEIVRVIGETDAKLSETIQGRVSESLSEKPDAICVAIEGQAAGFRKIAGLIERSLPEIANEVRMICAAADAVKWWDHVDDVLGISR